MIHDPFLPKFSDRALGHIVKVLSLTLCKGLLHPMGLTLRDPTAFQERCFAATADVPAAYYDDDAMGWATYPDLIGQNFRNRELPKLKPADRAHVLHWLANGYNGDVHAYPYRDFWISACTWAAVYDEITALVQGPDLDVMRDFAAAFQSDKTDPAWTEAKHAAATAQETFLDTWQITKFHIQIIDDALIQPPFILLNRMREAHLLKRHCDAYLSAYGDPEPLERMVRLYATRHEKSSYVQAYVADSAGYAIGNLWTDIYLEGTRA